MSCTVVSKQMICQHGKYFSYYFLCWICFRRKRRGQIPDHRATSGERVTALETAFTRFPQRTTDAVVTAPGCCAELLPVVRGGEGEGGWL
jgi:hypothetical protein